MHDVYGLFEVFITPFYLSTAVEIREFLFSDMPIMRSPAG